MSDHIEDDEPEDRLLGMLFWIEEGNGIGPKQFWKEVGDMCDSCEMAVQACQCGKGEPTVALFVRVSVALGKGEIREDVALGHVPRDVASFGDLHDHRDANEYGGLCNEEYLAAWGLSSATEAAAGNDIQNLLDEWIKEGGLQ
jgi:hypothetical protein